MQFIDTHAHVNFNAFKEDGEEVIKRALKEGVLVVNVGSQYSTSQRTVEYAHKFKNGVWATVGIHPIQLDKRTMHLDDQETDSSLEMKTRGEDYDEKKYLEIAKDEKVVAIGEVGLDYHHFDKNADIQLLKEKQKGVLVRFIQLANSVNKPIVLHCWDAYEDLLEILKRHPINKKGIVHSFIGNYKTANKFIQLGYKISLNGIITYSSSYDRLIRKIDLENIVIETDCPYLTPRPLEKEKRNEPLFVKIIADKIARVKGITTKEVARITTKNAKKIFDI